MFQIGRVSFFCMTHNGWL